MDSIAPAMKAKHPVGPVAGPYGHPIHPMLVSVPIGTWLASLVFDIIGFASADPEPFAATSRILILIGLVGAVLAAFFGMMDASRIERGTKAHRTAMTHMALNLSVTVVFLVNLLIRHFADPERISIVGFVLSIIALNRPDFRSYRIACPAGAGWADSRSA